GGVPLDLAAIRRFAALLRSAERCGIYVGRGCFHADAELKALSELLQAPVASSVNGRGILPEDEPLSVGFGFGSNGSKIAREVFADCDAVLAIGCKFGEVSTGSYSFKLPKTLIHVDINPDNLNRVFTTEHSLACDAAIFLRELLGALEGWRRTEDLELKARIRRGKESFVQALLAAPQNSERVDPGKFYALLRRQMNRLDTLTVDIGNHELWAISCFEVLAKGTFLCPTNFSAMGFAIPSAIATQLLRPEQR